MMVRVCMSEGGIQVRVCWSASSLTVPSVHPPRHCASHDSHT